MNILIADDHTMHRELLKVLLEHNYPEATIMQAEDYLQVRSACIRHRPSLLILDVFMPGMNSLVEVGEIIRQFPKTKVLICSAIDNPTLIQTLLAFGARGYVSKSMSADNLLDGIETVLKGDHYTPSEILAGASNLHLTERQWEILGMVCMGLTNKEIARRLDLSVSTVKFHVGMVLAEISRVVTPGLITFFAASIASAARWHTNLTFSNSSLERIEIIRRVYPQFYRISHR